MNVIAAVLGLLMQIGLPFPGPGLVGAPPPVTLANKCINDSGDALTISCTPTPSTTITSGNLLIAVCAEWTGFGISAPTVTDTLGNTWTQRGTTGTNTSNFNSNSWLFTATASSTGTDSSITCHMSEGFLDIAFLEYSGATALDSGATDFANNNSAATGVTHSVTSTVTDTLITYTFVAATTGSTLTTPTGFTQQLTKAVFNNTFKVYDKSAVAAGAQSVANVGTGTTPLHSGLIGIHP